MEQLIFDPKPDITAFELATILQQARGVYLEEIPESVARHFYFQLSAGQTPRQSVESRNGIKGRIAGLWRLLVDRGAASRNRRYRHVERRE